MLVKQLTTAKTMERLSFKISVQRKENEIQILYLVHVLQTSRICVSQELTTAAKNKNLPPLPLAT